MKQQQQEQQDQGGAGGGGGGGAAAAVMSRGQGRVRGQSPSDLFNFHFELVFSLMQNSAIRWRAAEVAWRAGACRSKWMFAAIRTSIAKRQKAPSLLLLLLGLTCALELLGGNISR